MDKINVFIVDRNSQELTELQKMIEDSKELELIGIASDAKECLLKIQTRQVINLLIFNLSLPMYDGYYLLRHLKTIPTRIDFLICTAHIASDQVLSYLAKKHVDVFVYKPYQIHAFFNSLIEISKQLMQKEVFNGYKIVQLSEFSGLTHKTYELEKRIILALHQLRIPGHVSGYEYIKMAVSIAYYQKNLVGKITKEIYPEIAAQFQVSDKEVERSIRSAILTSWKYWQDIDNSTFLGNCLQECRHRPTNGEFIALLSKCLKLEDKHQILMQVPQCPLKE